MVAEWLAHSARPKRGVPVQPYGMHLHNTVQMRALPALEAMLPFYCGLQAQIPDRLRTALLWAMEFHDLGKLADENQAVLRGITGDALPYLHESAGALHCLEHEQRAAAFAIHSHHQGLTNASAEREQHRLWQIDKEPCRPFVRDGEYAKTVGHLPGFRLRHEEAKGGLLPRLPEEPVRVLRWQRNGPNKVSHLSALEMRLLLSLLVDADHGDTAHHYQQEMPVHPPEPHWTERLEKLKKYIAGLGKDRDGHPKPSARDPLRDAVYQDCLRSDPAIPLYACDAPVGSGKTTAVMAYLLRAAIENKLRRIFVVLPFTNIIQQSVDTYRKALVLDGEDPEQIVAENHHVAEFQSLEARGLTTLWRSPIVVTTAVQFFETLAACAPNRLRKLHSVPGSAVFIDEAHAAMPLHLWPSMWCRLQELSDIWSCRFVLGSGSLPRFWENTRLFVSGTPAPPAMLRPKTVAMGAAGEQTRIMFRSKPEPQNLALLVQWLTKLKGARLVVMNTLQSAGALARELAQQGVQTLHLSTALTPTHRERVLTEARNLLNLKHKPEHGWVMVATSCIEAGVDVSFDVALRERSSVSSLIQISGRVNRSGDEAQGEVWDFTSSDPLFTNNKSLHAARGVVEQAFRTGLFDLMAGDAMTIAIQEEWKRKPDPDKVNALKDCEQQWQFATIAELSRLIEDDSVTAVVDPVIIAKLNERKPVRHTELVRGSVSVRKAVAEKIGLCKFHALRDDHLYIWPEKQYDESLLGIMKYLLTLKDISDQKFAMV